MNRGQRKVVVGVVTSDKMEKTVTVESERRYKHPRFEKYLRTVTRYKVHDERGEAKAGDRVRIMETRPLSKTKRWRLVEVVGHARGVEQS